MVVANIPCIMSFARPHAHFNGRWFTYIHAYNLHLTNLKVSHVTVCTCTFSTGIIPKFCILNTDDPPITCYNLGGVGLLSMDTLFYQCPHSHTELTLTQLTSLTSAFIFGHCPVSSLNSWPSHCVTFLKHIVKPLSIKGLIMTGQTKLISDGVLVL